jgi:dolichyl-phosphate-mannose-protein mannosyltransferase
MRIDIIVAALVVILHLICIQQYGWFRDELYFIACSKHLAWGYVDQPPMIAVLIWIARHLLGESLFALRIFAVLGHAGVVLMTGALVRRLSPTSSTLLACTAAALAPIWLSVGHIMTMNIFEPLFWMGCVLVALAIFDGASEKLWLLFGLLAGLGLENKQSTAFFGGAVVIGLLLTGRRGVFARPWIWLGGVVAFLVALPNILWQYQHHFPMLELLHNIAESGKNAPVTPLSFLGGNAILMNPVTLPLWVAGAVWLLMQPRFRWLGIAFVALLVWFIVMKGKIYYFSPMMPVALAAGAIACERLRASVRGSYLALIVVMGLLVVPLAIPILPVETFIAYQQHLPIGAPKTESHRMGPLPQHYADMFGWPEMAAVVARAYNRLTPAERAKCGIFGQNYGQAGAIDFFGRRYGLPHAISGHQNYYLWGPDGYDGSILIVMDDDRETLEKIFDRVEEAGVVDHPYAMPYERHRTVFICRGMKMPMRELWPKIKKWI